MSDGQDRVVSSGRRRWLALSRLVGCLLFCQGPGMGGYGLAVVTGVMAVCGVLMVVGAVVVMEDRYDRPTTTSSIRCTIEVLYADLSTGRAVGAGRAAGQVTVVPNRHPRDPHSGRGTASSPVVVIHDHRERCETPGRTVGSTWHHRDGAEKFPGAVDGARKFRTPSPR